MFQCIKSIAIVLAVTATGGLTKVEQQGHAAALAPAGAQSFTIQTFAASCQQVLRQYDHDFSANVSVADGCGCFANAVAQDSSADLLTTSRLLREVVASDSAQTPDWSTIAQTVGVDDRTLGHLLQVTNTAIGACMQA